MKNTWFFNSLKVIVSGLLLSCITITASWTDTSRSSSWRNAPTYTPEVEVPAVVPAPVVETVPVVTTAAPAVTEGNYFVDQGVNPYLDTAASSGRTWGQWFRGLGSSASNYVPSKETAYNYTVAPAVRGYNAVYNATPSRQTMYGYASPYLKRETYAPLLKSETYKQLAGKGVDYYKQSLAAISKYSNAAGQWAYQNPKYSIPLGVVVVAGVVVGTYYINNAYAKSWNAAHGKMYIALKNEFQKAIEQLSIIKVSQAGQVKGSTSRAAQKEYVINPKTGLFNEKPEYINTSIVNVIKRFNNELSKVERGYKWPAQYKAIKTDMTQFFNDIHTNIGKISFENMDAMTQAFMENIDAELNKLGVILAPAAKANIIPATIVPAINK